MAQNGHFSFRYLIEYCTRAQEFAMTTINEGLYCYASTESRQIQLIKRKVCSERQGRGFCHLFVTLCVERWRDHQHTASSLNYHNCQTMATNKLPAKKKKEERITLSNLQLALLIQANRWVRKGKAGDQGSADKHRTQKYRSTTVHQSRVLEQQERLKYRNS